MTGRKEEIAQIWRARTNLSADERERRRVAHDKKYRTERRMALQKQATVSARGWTPEKYDAAVKAISTARAVGIKIKIRCPAIEVAVGWDDVTFHPNAKNAMIYSTLGCPERTRIEGSTRWVGGIPKEYTRAQDDTHVLSAAFIERGGALLRYTFQVPGKTREVWTHGNPGGSRWEKDEQGLRLILGPDDYHPTSRDLRGGTAAMLQKLQANAETRRRLAAQQAVDRAEAEGVFVCLADSIRAGNCKAGSETWAKQHGLDTRRHISASDLMDIAGDSIGRVRLVIRSAMTRHKTEMLRGYANIADHTIAQ